MSVSKIEICNVALAMLGADSIRSFEENNKRSRMASVFFDFTRDYLLRKFDWPFARSYSKIQPLSLTIDIPESEYPYGLPSDCHAPRDLQERGSDVYWTIRRNILYCRFNPDDDIDVFLYYTSKVVDVSQFSSTFSNLLAIGLAVKMCIPITQDKALAKTLMDLFYTEQLDAFEADANIGDEYREFDENPEYDTFVNPDYNNL